MSDYLFDMPFVPRVWMGLIKGAQPENKFAESGSLTLNVETDIWSYSGTEELYTYPVDDTAPIDTISSDNIADVGNNVTVYGLDINADLTTQVVVLNGQNKVVLSTPLWRVYRMQVSASPTQVLGDTYCYEDTAISGGIPVDTTKVKAYVTAGDNQTLMCQYTIPRDYTGYVTDFYASIIGNVNADATITNKSRCFGNGFCLDARGGLKTSGSSSFTYGFKGWFPVPEKTDMKVTVKSDSNGSRVTATYTLIIIKNDLLDRLRSVS